MMEMPHNDDIHALNVLICDDSITNVLILSKLLESEGFTSVKTLTDARRVLPVLEQEDFDLLLLDIEMPHLNGFDVMQQIANSPVSKRLMPIMVLTGCQGHDVRNKALKCGAQDFVNKPFDQVEVVLRVENLLRVRLAYLSQFNLARKLEYMVTERTCELGKATDILIEKLAKAAEMRDKNTGRHVLRVGQYARILSDAYGLPQEVGYLVEKSAPLHDVGKIGIPDAVLLKKGGLTQEERVTMDSHTKLGADLLSNHESLLVRMASSIALSHHEHWDGSGYPSHIQGEAIPIEGRITAIADVFDALTTVRPYKEPWSVDEALQYLKQQAGAHFDPVLVALFVENIDKIKKVRAEFGDMD